jgi:hypothetical protein
MKSLKELKGIFEQEAPQGERSSLPNNYYPFWDMKANQKAVIRFLPDANQDNPRGFLVEKVFHNLTINGQRKMVPCLSMYGEDCPICKISQEYYKAKDDVNGKKYWKKKQYMAQVLVVEDPLTPDANTGENHEGKVRLVSLGFQIYNIIKEAFTSDELESVPYAFETGYDFIIKKTEQGQYASYAVGTKFQNRPRALTEEEISVVEEGLIELNTLLPKNPGIEKVQAMLNAELNGEEYRDDNGFSDKDDVAPARATAKTAPAPQPTRAAPAAEPVPDAEASGGDADVDDMLAAIRARRAGKK